MIYTQWFCKWIQFCTYPNDRIQLCHGDLLGPIHGRRHLLLVLQQTASPCHQSSFKASFRKENRHHMQLDPTDKREMNWIWSHSRLPDICRWWNWTPLCARKIMDGTANRTVVTRTIEHVACTKGIIVRPSSQICLKSRTLQVSLQTPWSEVLLEKLSPSSGQEILRILRKTIVHYRVPQQHVSYTILSQINPAHDLQTDVFKIHFNIILPSKPGLSKRSLIFRFPHQKPACTSPLSPVPPPPITLLRLGQSDNIWSVQITKLLVM